MNDIVIVIPAAGASRRMGGRDKLLEKVDGIALLRRQAERALQTGARVIVTLPAGRDGPRRAALDGLDVTLIAVPDADEGMGASLRAGIAAALTEGTATAVMILPADMPEIAASDLAALIAAFRSAPGAPILRGAAADGRPGHPVLFPRDVLEEDAAPALGGDAGARAILRRHGPRVRCVPLPGSHALTDLDTPDDWAAWRARTGR
ncbi:CTP--molybdopterin cytidylyltransferase [Rhodobacteraceae bacterium WD3A24]|nr:CTP--molybdopterin cytidylyltransferase [Rhodobacteraceae bacterium WD3A24]